MRTGAMLRIGLAGVLAVLIGWGPTGAAWAQQPVGQPASPGPTSVVKDIPAGTSALATAAAVAGTVFWIPVKALALCPGMALAAGASLAVTAGRTDTSDYFLRIGCEGTWIITPAMVRGQEEFQESGAP